ncbi:MAG: M56 family metallopeptidase [Eubacterium sp.]|nr:M56 family metallopeptidase [Eubacterium sp.]
MDIIGRSLSAAAVIAVIMFMRNVLFGKLPKRMLPLLWLLAAAKLLLPVPVPSGDAAAALSCGEAVTETVCSETPAVYEFAVSPITVAVPFPENGFAVRICEYVWLFGAVFTGAFFLLSHIKSRRIFSCALPAECSIEPLKKDFGIRRTVRVLVSDRTDCPLTYGVFAPVVILPKNVDPNCGETRNILCHELAHIKRLDALFKPMLALCVAVHWFNPMVWVMFVLACRDVELACDETALKYGKASPEDYAMTLVFMEEIRGFRFAESFAGGSLEERIRDVMSAGKAKKSVLAALSAACFSLAAAAVLNVTVAPYGAAAAVEANAAYGYSVTAEGDGLHIVTEDAPGLYSVYSYGDEYTALEKVYYSDVASEEISEGDYMISVASDIPDIEVSEAETEIGYSAKYPIQGYYSVVYDYPMYNYAHSYTETEKGDPYTYTTVVVTVAENGSEAQTKVMPARSGR